jgi:uncharacterized protein YecT (DUF1311 family)
MLKIVLQAWLADADSRCRRLEGAALHQAQGDAQRCEALIDLLEHAEKRLTDLENTLRVRPPAAKPWVS